MLLLGTCVYRLRATADSIKPSPIWTVMNMNTNMNMNMNLCLSTLSDYVIRRYLCLSTNSHIKRNTSQLYKHNKHITQTTQTKQHKTQTKQHKHNKHNKTTNNNNNKTNNTQTTNKHNTNNTNLCLSTQSEGRRH
jgi:FKBP-type peptidyl-prolyl cis-trans isomerase